MHSSRRPGAAKPLSNTDPLLKQTCVNEKCITTFHQNATIRRMFCEDMKQKLFV